MKGSPREHSPTCSCTSCKSTRVPLKRSDGDGIDKLNLGKNIPLKERILLTKLTRARADYDALRTQLLSSSSDTEKADLRLRKHVKHPEGIDSSSILLDIVDFVDRGATLNSLSECCSCCICSSTDVENKRHKDKHGHHRHTETISEGGKDVKRKKKGKPEMEVKAELKPPTKITEPEIAAERKPKPKEKAVLKKALNTTTSKIKSASCTCTLKFSDLIKESKEAVMKLRKEKKPKKEIEDTRGFWIDEYTTGQIIRRPKELSRESYERIEEAKRKVKKHLKAGADKSLEKLKILQSKAKLKDKARRSIDKLKESKTTLKVKINKSLEKVKTKIKAPPKPTKTKHEEEVKPSSPRSVTPSESETEPEIAFPVDKDTLEEFRKKHKNIKDWVCGPECIPKKCRPKKCLEILIRKKGHKSKQTRIKSKSKIHKKKITSSSASSQAGGISTTKVGPKTKVNPQKKNKKEGHKKPQMNLSMKGKSKEGLDRKILSKSESATSSISVKSAKKGTTLRKGKIEKGTSPERKRSVKSVTDVAPRSIKKPVQTLTAVKSKVSCICVSPEGKKSTTSVTVVSRPYTNFSQAVSVTKKPEIKHRTRKIKAEHKKRPVSQSSTLTSSTVSIIRKPRAHRLPKHKTKKIKATHATRKQKKSMKSLTTVKSNVSCTCSTPERTKSTKSMTVISKPSAKLSQPVSSAKKPEHRTRKIKAEHKKRPVSRSTTPSSPSVSITQKPRAHRSPKHKTKKIKATHAARSTTSQSTAIVPIKLHKKPASHKAKKVKTHKSYTGGSTTAAPNSPKPLPQQKIRPHRPKSIASQGITAVSKPRPQRDMRPEPQQTITTSRQITAINSLRRCFCTLKLGKPNKIKRPKAKHDSKESETSEQSIQTIPSQREMHVSRTVATDKSEKDRYRQRKLLPYECEPRICVPNSCDPYECIKLINKREGPHLKRHARRSATSNHETRSTSSFRSRKVHHKTKRVQSTVFTYKTEVPARKYKQTVTTITKPPRVGRTSPSSMSRQAVKIGSSFSFSIEFYKNRPSVASDVPVKQVHRREIAKKEVRERAYRLESPKPPKKKHPKKVQVKASESSSYVNVKHQQKSSKKVNDIKAKQQQKSISTKTKQTGNIGSAIVKCFCNLKWTKVKPKKKAAQTTAKEELKVATVGTETKRKKYKLKPYECEPYICIPGECDPYECLERIKKRMHSGTSPKKIRTRSVSSIFYSSVSSAAIGTSRPRLKRQDTSTKRKRIRDVSESISPTLVSRPAGTAPKQIHLIKRPMAAPARQAVRIGSTFSFDIEFYKKFPSAEEKVIVHPSSERQIHESVRQMKERKKELKTKQTDRNRRNMKSPAKVVSQSNQVSQVATIKKRDRNVGVKPLLKRCFCTLQLQKELKKKQKPMAKIYTVSRVTVGETRITAQRQLMSYQSKHSTLGHEYELYRSREITIGNKQYQHPDSSAYTKLSSSESNMALKQEQRQQSSQHCHEGQLSNEISFHLKPCDSYSTSQTPEETELDSFTSFVTFSKSNTEPKSGKQNQTQKFMKSSEQKTSFSFSRSLVSSISPVIRRWFRTMHPYMSNKNNEAGKLSPESQKGVFSPNKCDLGQCELIMKRLLKKSSRMSCQSRAMKSKPLCANNKRSVIKAKNRLSRPNFTIDLQTKPLSSFPQVIKSVPIHSERQTVYAASNFSINMEYQKTEQFLSPLPCPPQMVQPVLDFTSIKYVNQRTNQRIAGNNVHTDHSNSKSTEKFEAKTSHNLTPKLIRCENTMKLRNKQRKKDSNTQNTITNSKNIKHEIKPQTSGVRPNTKPLRSIQVYRLDPNECDPGICIPGSCSPYECIKLINIRNRRYQNRGLCTTNAGTKSVQSHTSKRHRKERQVQHHATNRKHRANVIREKHSPVSTRSVSPTKVAYPHRQVTMSRHESGNRQAIRIGSTCSFDLEFYKNTSQHLTPTIIKEVRSAPKAPRNKNRVYAPKKRTHSTKSHDTKSTARSVGGRKALHTRKSQIHTNKHDQKAGPSKLKRCFCTLELQKKGKHHVHASPYKMEKPAKNQYTKTVPYKTIATAHSRSVVAKEKTRKRPKLLPYECEPSACVPGSCSPIKCLERIKRRNLKEMGTDARRPRSESTKTSNTTRTRAKGVQRHHERPKAAHSTATTKAPKQKKVHTERVIKVPTHKVIESSHSSSDRQVVRIGSNFSFNMEFFKDRGGGSPESITKVQKVYHPPPPKVKRELKTRPSRMKPPKTRHAKSHRPKNIRSMQSQAVAKHVRNKMTEVKPFLKRCFCTLKLQNRIKDKTGKSTKSKPVKKAVKNVGSTVSKKPHKGKNLYQREHPHKTKIHKHEKVKNVGSAISKKPHKNKKQYQKEQPHKTKIHKQEKVKNVGSAVSKKPHNDKKQYKKEQPHNTKIHKHKNKNKALASTSTTANLKVIMPPKAGVSTTTTKSTRKHKVRKLKPYECEPGVCTPGQCNPYECLKRIKHRKLKTTKSGTHHHRERTTSSHTTRTAKQRRGQTTGRHHKHNRQSQMTTKQPKPQATPERHLVEQSRFKSTSSSLRQAVRISSSFSFSVEFYKETPSSNKSVKPAKPTPVKIIKQEHHEPKRKKSQASDAHKKRIRDQGIHAHEKQIKHHGAQHETKTNNKGAGIRPLLKRCFCTLALKKADHKLKATKPTPKTVESKTVATKTRKERKSKVKEHKAKNDTATVGVATKKELYVLKPYECEPFVCVPGQCDPYECDKRIRRRIMKDCGTGDRPCKNQCAVTYTRKDGTFRCIDTQCDMKRKHGAKSTATIATRPPKLHPVPQYRKPLKQNVMHVPNNSQRQSVNIGSNFSFDIEFFKDRMDRPAKEKAYIPKEKHLPRPVKVKEVATRKLPKNTTGTGKYYNYRDQKHGAGVAIDHKGTGMSPLKRCFCTLKLQKALVPPLNVMRVEVQRKAGTQTKPMRVKKEKPRKLAPGACEPGYCISGECDPWKCLEKMRRKLCKEQGTCTHAGDQGTKCIAAKCIPICRHQNTQCNLKHGKKYTQKTERVPTPKPKQMPRPGIVEVPRFPTFRPGVKIGSNISCCIEFYKETVPPSFETRFKPVKIHRVQEPKQSNKPPKQPKMVLEGPALKQAKTGYSSKRRYKDCDMQADCMKKTHKGIEAGKMLKRCFCTLKLQDTAAYKKMYTVGRVTVLEDRRNSRLICKQTKNEVKNSIGSELNTHENFLFPSRLDCKCYDCVKFKENQLICNVIHTANKTDSMKIIFPYHPHKFNNNISNTLINNKNMRHQFPDIYCTRRNYDRHKKHDKLTLEDSRKKEKKDKKSMKYKEPAQEESEKTVFNKFKGFIRRCMGLFKKTTTEKIVSNKAQKLPELKPTERKKKNKRSKQEKKSDSNVLKTSKSDRHPTNAKIVCIPKTSKSVKVTKVSERDKCKSQFQEKWKKKYSRFQSGDTAQTQMKQNIQNKVIIPEDQKKLVKNRLEHIIQNLIAPSATELNKNNNVMCYYNQMHYNGQINNFMKNRPPFMDHKVVQMATMKRFVGKNCDPVLCTSTKTKCPCSGKPVKVLKNEVHIQNFDNYKPPKYFSKNRVSKNPNYYYNKTVDSQGKCCSRGKPKKIPCQPEKTRTQPEPKPKAKHTNNKIDICKTSKPCACCKGGRKKVCSLFRKKKNKDPDKKHVEFILSKNNQGKCVVECKVNSPKDVRKVKKALNKNKLVCDRTPLLEMRLNSDDLRILNTDRVHDEINKIETLKLGKQAGAHYKNIANYGDLTTEQLIQIHGKSCSCCICTNRRKAERSPKLLKGQKPCICGSKPCARLSFKKAAEDMARRKAERERKVCPCGMKICSRETLKLDVKKKIISKKKAHKLERKGMSKIELRRQKKQRKLLLERQKRYKIEDDERRARRRREERYLDQQVQKYQDTSDVLLVAESALDVTTLAVSSVARTIRCICRSIFNYKDTIQSIKNAKEDPARILTNIKGVYEDSGIRSTFRRVRKRMEATRIVQMFQKRVENIPVMNFAIHACDRDPKKRLARKRKARRREPIEFGCSLFMASLRKRPYLSIYYLCPWFYPHCVNMIGIFKQFADVMLFILAVIVWSPCILAMEICRTLMCCTLCTG